MVQEHELTWLVGSFEHDRAETKRFRKEIGVSGVEHSLAVKEPDASRAFSGLDYQLNSPRIQPVAALENQSLDALGGLAQTPPCGVCDVPKGHAQVGSLIQPVHTQH
jgi:hypothetical protein